MNGETSRSVPTTYVDWHCNKCGYHHEAKTKTYSYPVNCPSCGGERTTQCGHRVLPTNQVYRDAEPRRYNLCGGEKEVQVYMCAATGERAGHTMPEEWVPDCSDDPIFVASAVLDICKTKYIYSSNKDKVAAVLSAMEKCADMSERNRAANRINELRASIIRDVAEYADLVESQDAAIAKRQETINESHTGTVEIV